MSKALASAEHAAGPLKRYSPISFSGRRGQFHKTLRQMRLAERVNQSEVERAAYLFVARNTQFPWALRLTTQLAFNNRVLFPKYSSPGHWAPRCIATNARRKPSSFTGNLERSEFKEAFIEGRVPGYERAHW